MSPLQLSFVLDHVLRYDFSVFYPVETHITELVMVFSAPFIEAFCGGTLQFFRLKYGFSAVIQNIFAVCEHIRI